MTLPARTARLSCGLLAGALLYGGPASPASAQTNPPVPAILQAEPPPGTQLVDVSRDYRDKLLRVGDSLARGETDAAVEALHLLITADAPEFHPHWSDRRRHVSSVSACTRLLGALPPAVLEAYRRLRGPAARRLREAAGADPQALRQVGRRYFHTPEGAQAYHRYAQSAFDEGHFLAAAEVWEQLFRHGTNPRPPPALLAARAAAGYHLAGLPDRVAALSEELRQQYPQAAFEVAGKRRNLADFVRGAVRHEPPPAPPPAVLPDWPAAAGAPHGAAVMLPCAVSPLAAWSQAPAERAANAGALLQLNSRGGWDPVLSPVGLKTDTADGRLRVTLEPPGLPPYGFDLPAMLRPAVVPGAIVLRREQDLAAVRPLDGRELWRVPDFPVCNPPAGRTRNHYLPVGGDMGRHTVTVADGRAYAVGRFRRVNPETYRKFASSLSTDSSSLLAVDAADGRVLWEVGRGMGEHELLRSAKFLTAPTCSRGRLYVLAKTAGRYRLLCLDARNGQRIWDSLLGPIPAHTAQLLSWQSVYTMEVMTERASPAAVSRNRVYLTTNGGLVAAFETDWGHPLWTYRYDSTVSGTARDREPRDIASLAFIVSAARRPLRPPNPLIVTRGRVICLPSDSETVLALHAETGECLWEVPRNGARHLAAVDGNRLLLCDPGLTLLSVRDGSTLKRIDVRVADRPAVTSERILAAGRGSLVQVDLNEYLVDEQTVDEADALLGTLVAAEGRLVSANAAGLSVFVGFDEGWSALGKRIDALRKDPPRAAALRLQRGVLAFRAARYERAEAEFEQAAAMAARARAKRTAEEAETWRYRACLALAQAAEDDAAAGRWLDLAARLAGTERRRLRVDLRRMVRHEQFGRPARAAEVAQQISEQFPALPVAPPAGDRDWASGMTAYTYGQEKIRRLVAAHGRSAAAAFDARVAAVLRRHAARATADPLVRAQRRWPHAAGADECLLAAANAVWTAAERAGAAEQRAAAVRASRLLGEIENYPESEVLPVARAAQLLVDERFRPGLTAWRRLALAGAATNTVVRFGGFEGPLADVLRRRPRSETASGRDVQFVDLPAAAQPLYRSTGGPITLVRDAGQRPLAWGELLFACNGAALFCIDSRRNTWEQSLRWQARLQTEEPPPRCLGAVDRKARCLAVVSDKEWLVVDIPSGRQRARAAVEELAMKPWRHAVRHGPCLAIMDRHGFLTGMEAFKAKRLWGFNAGDLDDDMLEAGCELLHGASRSSGYARVWEVRNGRELYSFNAGRGRQGLSSAMNRDGFMATLDGRNGLQFHDPRAERGRIAQHEIDASALEIVDFGQRQAVLRDRDTHETLRLYDVAGEYEACTVSLGNGRGRPGRVVRTLMSGPVMYLLCAESEHQGGLLTRPGLAAVGLPEGRVLWRRALTAADDERLWDVMGPQRRDAFVVAGLQSTGAAVERRQVALDQRDGAPAMDFRGWPAEDGEKTAAAAAEVGGPLIMNGKAYVETADGLVCLRSAPP